MAESGPQDWYRNTEWNHEIAATFHAKLARARSQKPQYLCIQAGCLAKRHPDAALGLIDQYLDTDDTFHLATARDVQGQAYLALDQLDPAVSAFKQALLREEEFPNVTSNTRLDFPRLVALRRIREEYDYALDILNSRFKPQELAMPVNRYIDQGVRALIAHDLGDRDRAREFACAALDAASDRTSVFAKHPGIGLVESTNTDFGRRIKRIAKRGLIERIAAPFRA